MRKGTTDDGPQHSPSSVVCAISRQKNVTKKLINMKATLNTLHHQDGDWMRELEFYKEEIAILTGRLEEASTKNNSKDATGQVEHFSK